MVGLGGIEEIPVTCRSAGGCRSRQESEIDLSSVAGTAVDCALPLLVVQRGSGGLLGRIVGVSICPVACGTASRSVVVELNPNDIKLRRENHVTHVGILETIFGLQWTLRGTGNDILL